jgi:hypothetical protein
VGLFNGKDLTGWEGSRGVWQVKDGMIFATTFPTGRRQNTFLCLKGTFRDFELEFDVRAGGSNSGVMFRSELLDRENYWLNGVKCDLGERSGWGTLVTYNDRNGSFLKNAQAAPAQKAANPGDFNRILLRCVGKKVSVSINGTLIHEVELPNLAAEGRIGFQLRFSDPTEVSLKNIRIRRLSSAGDSSP